MFQWLNLVLEIIAIWLIWMRGPRWFTLRSFISFQLLADLTLIVIHPLVEHAVYSRLYWGMQDVCYLLQAGIALEIVIRTKHIFRIGPLIWCWFNLVLLCFLAGHYLISHPHAQMELGAISSFFVACSMFAALSVDAKPLLPWLACFLWSLLELGTTLLGYPFFHLWYPLGCCVCLSLFIVTSLKEPKIARKPKEAKAPQRDFHQAARLVTEL